MDLTSPPPPPDRQPQARRRKLFDAAELQTLILHMVNEGRQHGYEIMREIEERSGGGYAPSPGVIYPTLTLLLDMGLLDEAQSEGARKSYTVSAQGRTTLAERAPSIEELMTRLATIEERVSRTDSAPVRRAMQNLRQAVMDRLSKADTEDADIFEVARLIDETAGRVERL